MYWPEIEVVHIGGESSRQVKTLEMSQTGAQLVLWRMRSTLLYFRKHKGWQAGVVRWMEEIWSLMRAWRNGLRSSERAKAKSRNHYRVARLMRTAWLRDKRRPGVAAAALVIGDRAAGPLLWGFGAGACDAMETALSALLSGSALLTPQASLPKI